MVVDNFFVSLKIVKIPPYMVLMSQIRPFLPYMPVDNFAKTVDKLWISYPQLLLLREDYLWM